MTGLGADVVVVGAGMAGLSAAAAVAARGASVLVLEQEASPGLHATGRSAALFDEGYGNSVVRRLTVASREALSAPVPGADGPVLSPRGTLRVGGPGDEGALDDAAATAVALVPATRRVDAAQARQHCPGLSPSWVSGGILDSGAADIDVDVLLGGHLRALRAAGGSVVCGAAVVGGDRSRGRWRLDTTAGPVGAEVVVDAAGAWADVVAARCGVAPLGLVPMRRTAFLFDAPGHHPAAMVREWPMVLDVHERWYFKPEGGRLLGSPADETPSEPVDARPEELDVAIALDRIGAALGVELRHADRPWAGLRTFSTDRTPVVGRDPDVEGFVWLAGQGGYGIQTSPAMAAAAAAAVRADGWPAHLAAAGVSPADLDPERLRDR